MSGRVLSFIALAMLSSVLSAQTFTPAHYIVGEIDRDDVVTIRSIDDVTIAGELSSYEPELLATAARTERDESGRIDVVLRDLLGNVVFRTRVVVERDWRAEHARDAATGAGEIDGRRVPAGKASFVVRVPRLANVEMLEMTPAKTQRTTRVALRDVPKTRVRGDVVPLADGNPANRLDLLIMGDGYTSAQSGKFQTDADALATQFFGIAPYSTYSNYVNVTKYFVASSQSGADHPVCSDPSKSADPLEGTFVNTAFDATFCTSNIQRLLTVNGSKVFAAAAAVPNWDVIMVVVNDDMYGGAGGGISTVSTNSFAVDVARHEFGHSFTGLADEYTSPYPGYPACSDLGGSPCEANVTNVTTRASVKWNPWISPSTPVPTTPAASYPSVPGLFEGARYLTSGMYRPKYNCLMNNLGVGFCEICRQEYILELYRGWGGVPAAGIDQIEPGTESPAPGATTASVGVAKPFTVTTLEPAGGPASTKQWSVDGVVQGSATTNTFNWTPSSGGSHTVELRVTDATTFVNASMAGTTLQSTRTWTVGVSIAGPATFSATAGTSSVALTWSAVSGVTNYEVARSSGGGFTTIATVGTTSHNDSTVSSGVGYIYKVRAVGGAYSVSDLATVFTATDDPVSSSVKVKALHLTQLRTAINTARTAAGLGAATYTFTPTPGGTVKAIDVAEMRTALNAARTAVGMTAFSFTDPTLTAQSSTIKGVHVNELRAALR